MRLLERLSLVVFFIGFLVKISDLPFGSEIMTIAAATLTLLYFCLGFIFFNDVPLRLIFKSSTYSNIGAGRVIGAFIFGWPLSFAVVGVLFKLVLFSGGNELIAMGLPGVALVLVAAAVIFISEKKTRDLFYTKLFVRGGVAILIGAAVYFTPSEALIKTYYRNQPALKALFLKELKADPVGQTKDHI